MLSFRTLVPVLGLIGHAAAHARVWGIHVNGEFAGDGMETYIRTPPNNSPVKDVASPDIICNVANTPAPSSVPVAAGDKIEIEWFHDNRNDDIIDLSHKGPVLVYIAEASTNGEGAVWSKLAEEGLGADGKWAVDNLVANGGLHEVTLPSNLAKGDYLLRAEIIALHEGETNFKENSARGAQFYPSCIQISVDGSGNATPGGFNFIGGYTPTDPGILFNIYSSPTSYPIPGPEVGLGGDVPSTPEPEEPETPVPEPETPEPEQPETPEPEQPETPEPEQPQPEQPEEPETPAPEPTPAVPTPTAVPTTLITATAAPTQPPVEPTVPAPAPTQPAGGFDKTPEGINRCLDAVNECIRKMHQGSIRGGSVDFSSCEAQRAACY